MYYKPEKAGPICREVRVEKPSWSSCTVAILKEVVTLISNLCYKTITKGA